MVVPFQEMPPEARVWIYQADRKFTREQQELIETEAASFIERWTAHGEKLRGAFSIFYDRFLIISVDESFNQASGCSIDSSVHFIKELESKLELNLLDRQIAILKQNGTDKPEVELEQLPLIRQKINAGYIDGNTIIFNNTVTNKKDFLSQWEVEAKNSWMAKYF